MPEIDDELDAELGEVGAPAEVDGAPGTIAERVEVAARRGAVERPLLGFEVARVDERLRPRRPELGLREPGVGLDAVRDREAHVAGLVRVALAAGVLARQAAAAHLVGPAQMRRR